MKNIFLIFTIISGSTAFSAPQLATTCEIFDANFAYRTHVREEIEDNRFAILDMSEQELEDALAVFINELVEKNGYLPGLKGAAGEPKTFWEIKARGIPTFAPLYNSLGSVFYTIGALLKKDGADPLKIREKMHAFNGAMLLHEYIQRQLLGQSSSSDVTGVLLRSYIAFDEMLSRAVRN